MVDLSGGCGESAVILLTSPRGWAESAGKRRLSPIGFSENRKMYGKLGCFDSIRETGTH